MKNDMPNFTDIENLSAYLDHELSEVEENQLRNRLAQDAKLREQLEDLRLTRYTLRNAPKVRRQRSFTLTPEMVRQQKFAWRAMNFSRMVAAAAGVLFALVVGGEILFGSGAGLIASAPEESRMMAQDDSANMQEAEEPLAMEAPVEEAMEAAPAEEVPIAPEADLGVEEPAPLEEPVEEPSMEMESVLTPTTQGTEAPAAAAEEPAGTPEPGGGGGAPPTPTEEPETAATDPTEDRSVPTEKNVEGEPDDVQEMPVDGDEEFSGMDSGDNGEQASVEEPPPVPERGVREVPLIRWIQAGLLLLAILSSAAALYFRRSTR